MKPNLKLICFYGPESTGKSTMAKLFAERYRTEFVPEVAREFNLSNDDLIDDDIINIGKAQTDRVRKKMETANQFLFCDTDLITTQIYSKIYLNVVPEILITLENEIHYDQYFLFHNDVPWVDDGLRDLGDRQEEMMKIFEDELVKRKIAFVRVQGNWHEREQIIKNEIEKMLHHPPLAPPPPNRPPPP